MMSRAGNPPLNARVWSDGDGAHIDVRGLPPPEPMVAILGFIRTLRAPIAVIVHHEREPHLLYAELAEIGWRAQRIEGGPGEVRLRIERSP